MSRIALLLLVALGAAVGCSSPATVEVRPDPLVLEGVGATGQLEPIILDESGKQITEGYAVAWLGTDRKVAKVHQDGRVEAQSTGKILVDLEVIGTEVRGMGNVVVKIPGSVVASHDELILVAGQGPVMVMAEVRSDIDTLIEGYVPTWKVDDSTVVRLEQLPGSDEPRTRARLTALKPGETYATASFKDLAADIRVVVVASQPPAPEAPAAQ
jgi:hypothetical protein